MLPEPSSIFTIPSLHDATALECRLYHPEHSASTQHAKGSIAEETKIAAGASKIAKVSKIATIAHPYTPLGGCFDDHVLHAAGRELLQRGYVLGLFNLRGAGASGGSSSWTSRPEQVDYCSFVGFLLAYLDQLHAHAHKVLDSKSSTSSIDGEDTGNHKHTNQTPILVLGGYSYGSHLVRQLPSIEHILAPFINPAPGSTAAEIHLRASYLAQQRMRRLHAAKPRGRTRTKEHAHTLTPMIVGGDESLPGSRRPSRESRASLDNVVRKTVERCSRASLSFARRRASLEGQSQAETQSTTATENDTPSVTPTTIPEIRYLLISPLLPPLSALLALSSLPVRYLPWNRSSGNTATAGVAAQEQEQLGSSQPRTLAIWGSEDGFTSSRRLEKWAKAAQASCGAEGAKKFDFYVIQGAGHFWLEDGVERQLRSAVARWLDWD